MAIWREWASGIRRVTVELDHQLAVIGVCPLITSRSQRHCPPRVERHQRRRTASTTQADCGCSRKHSRLPSTQPPVVRQWDLLRVGIILPGSIVPARSEPSASGVALRSSTMDGSVCLQHALVAAPPPLIPQKLSVTTAARALLSVGSGRLYLSEDRPLSIFEADGSRRMECSRIGVIEPPARATRSHSSPTTG